MWSIPFIFGGLLLSGVWVGICLGLTGAIISYFSGGISTLAVLPLAAWKMLYNYSFVALPMYILLGEIFVATGLAKKSYDAITPLLERVPGKLLSSNVVLDAMFGAIVGTSMATAATVGSIAYPELSKRGYNRTALVGNLAGAGTLGSFVPPSIGLIIYGSWVEIPIGSCFAAVLFPALITTILFIIYLMILCTIRPNIAPAGKLIPLRDAIAATGNIWPLIILMASIMGSIYFGIATAVEAAGLGSVIAILMCIGFKTFSFKKLHEASIATLKICGTVVFIMLGATILSTSLALSGILHEAILKVQAVGLSPIATISFICVLYLILGCFFDGITMLLMTLPFVFPLIMSAGVNPLLFGAIFVVAGEMGLLTPPVGMNLYILQGVTQGEVSLRDVARGSIPYFLLLGVTLILVIVFPQLCTWLPAHMK